MQTLGLNRTLHPTQHFWAHKLFLKTPKKFLYVCGMGYLWATHTPTCSSSFVVKTATLPFPPPSQERKKSLFLFFEKCGALMSPVSAPSFPWEVGGGSNIWRPDTTVEEGTTVSKKKLGIIKVNKRSKILELQCIMYVSDSDFEGEERGGEGRNYLSHCLFASSSAL